MTRSMRSMVGVALALGLLVLPVTGCAHDDGADANESAISGGLPATDYPEAATIDFTKDGLGYLCSGTVIAPRVVLTAGHCVVGGATGFFVRAGGVTTSGTSATVLDYAETAEVVNFTQHDVALIFLADPITLPLYPAIASGPVANGTSLMNVGRIQSGVQTDALFEAATRVTLPPEAPFDYTSTRVIQPGDSGGPDFIAGTHTIAAVNSGASDVTNTQYVARVDLVYDFIEAEIAAHGGGGGAPASGVIPNVTLSDVAHYEVVTSELNCRSGPGTVNPITSQLFAGQTLQVADAPGPRIQLALDGGPWLEVQPAAGGAACYVSANYQFIAPLVDQAPPNGRVPGTQNLVVTSGLYGSLALASHASTVTGSVRDGACELTLSGSLTGQNPISVTITTGTSTRSGTLNILDASDVALTVPNLDPACATVIPQAATGAKLTFSAAISPVVFGFRTVKSGKAFFHDGPGSPSNGKYVQNGQTIQQLGEDEGGYVQVRYTGATGPTTTGFLLESDLFDLHVAGTTL